MFDATQHLGLHTCSMLRNIWAWGGGSSKIVITFFNLNTCSMLHNIWACAHVRCYATSGLAHMFDATQHLGLHTCSMLRNIWAWGGGSSKIVITFLNLNTCSMLRNIWACTHVRCYATSGLAHMFDATQHHGLGWGWGWGVITFLNLNTCSMLHNIWACAHVRCYATSGLAHMVVATQHHGLGWGGGWVGGGDDDVLCACTHVLGHMIAV